MSTHVFTDLLHSWQGYDQSLDIGGVWGLRAFSDFPNFSCSESIFWAVGHVDPPLPLWVGLTLENAKRYPPPVTGNISEILVPTRCFGWGGHFALPGHFIPIKSNLWYKYVNL